MDERDRNLLTKIAGDACGGLACLSIGFAVFTVTLSFTVIYYDVEVWSVISIMVGIALAGILTRLTLFLSHYKDYKFDDVFKPVVKYLIVFSVVGIVLGGVLLPLTYNAPYPNLMCYEVAIGMDVGHSEDVIKQCYEYRNDVQQLLNGILIPFPIAMVFVFVIQIMYSKRKYAQ